MKILITGANGMLAKDVIKEFENDNDKELVLADRNLLDITNKENIENFINLNKSDLVINCAAYTAVDKAEDDEEKDDVLKINSEGVYYLADYCSKNNIKFIHFSTDYIFDGKNSNGYKEDDKTSGPVNFYGLSKNIGEQNILNISKNNPNFIYYIIRVSWLYGKEGKNFVKTMLSLSETKPELNIINDQHGSPTYTVDVAKRARFIIDNNLEKGIYHATNEGFTTWYEFTKEIFKIKNIQTKVNPITSSEYPSKAKRPFYSMLLNTKINPKMRIWQDALKEFLETI